MPWKEATPMSLRLEFVQLASADGANIRELCRRFHITPRTGYKWLRRFEQGGECALEDKSRRPRGSPRRTDAKAEAAILAVRDTHPAWGARKILCCLRRESGDLAPCASTITEVLRRHGRLNPEESAKHKPCHRFEKDAPNEMWQMDFKGHFPLAQGRCHPLTILDDHSRFLLELCACANERLSTVQARLVAVFRQYGLPERMLTDNGAPWGADAVHRYTSLSAWMIRYGIAISHSRPHHPETIGKDERLHRTLKAEAIQGHVFVDLQDCQSHFDQWRDVYNQERPHEALGMGVPVSRYTPSPRPFPETLPAIEYDTTDIVRKVQNRGEISYRNHEYQVGHAFLGYPVALRPSLKDGLFHVFFCQQKVAEIDLNDDNH